ncbi:MAG: hypothetical protein KGK03_04920 [Candidatus Omnitrophica bacterium]|nr:hypothetical protein [Candidatus Omnitrophota bacterium]MDE2222396.1 hypothetical protein [Candidatus Omnitrophota bacterium]
MSPAGRFLALVLLGLAAFFNALGNPFVHDDVVFILKNPHITDLNHWWQAFQVSTAAGGLNTYYRPLLEIFYRLEYRLFGPHPFGFHLVNVIIHIINGLLLLALLERLGLKKPVAWVVAALFLVHPVQTEAVDCIAGISNLWMALGVLGALHAYLERRHVLALLCFVAACLGKEQALMFIPLAVAIDCYRGQRNVVAWFFYTAAAVVLLALRHMVTGASLLKAVMASPGEFGLRLAAIARDILMYVRLIVFPYDLHYYRNTDILQPDHQAWCLLGIAVLVILFIYRRRPQARGILVLGLGWFTAALLPVLNVVPLVNEYSFILTPEHFLYLPMAGILILLVTTVDHFMKDFKKFLTGVVLAGCLLLTWHQNTFWSSEIALFERMLTFEPDFGRGQLLLAKAYYFNGQPQMAQPHFQKAFAIMSAYAQKTTNANAKRFYLRYLNEIAYYWSKNQCLMGKGRCDRKV